MTTRVLHIFSPNLSREFGGATIRWRYYFSKWDILDISHLILDTSKNRLVDANEALNFQFPENQKGNSKLERLFWIILLFRSLYTFKGKYDILHVHKLWWGGLFVGPWAKFYNIPAVCESVQYEADTPSGLKGQAFSSIKLKCLRSFNKIITVSEYLANDYLRNDFNSDQVIGLENCPDNNVFFPVSNIEEKAIIRNNLKLPTNKFIILFVGSILKRKGIDTLTDAFIKACQERSDLFLVIIGLINDKELYKLLIRSLEDQNLNDKFIFTGLLQDKAFLANYYRSADLFVLPSRREGLPNSLLEAMSSGLPVIASFISELKNTINNGENGIFFPTENSLILKDEILRIVQDPIIATRLGDNARRYILKKHSYVIWQSRIATLYKNLVKNTQVDKTI